MKVGLIGPKDREEMARLALRLAERSAKVFVFDSGIDPAIDLREESEVACAIDITGIQAFYVADLGLPSPLVRGDDGRIDLEASELALGNSRRRLAAWNALLSRVGSRCRVINPPRTHDLHALKPWEMMVYQQRDLPVPMTLAASFPEALLELPRSRSGGWIRKGLVGGYGYTESFEPPNSIEEAKARLVNGPIMIQERIVGENVRAFVLDRQVIGVAEIVSREGGETDSRRGVQRIRRVELPEAAGRAAVAAAECWGLPFAAVDFMCDAQQQYYLLECNSAPFFVNFERAAGLDIASRLADYLLKGRL